MAIGKASDFVIYQEQFYGGMYESINQNVAAFNGASQNCLRMVAKELKGDYDKESFIKDMANLITRRDTTSVAAATDLAMTHGEYIGVKVNRKIGPAAQTIDAFRKLGVDSKEMSFKLGGMVGERKMKDYANTAIGAVNAALKATTALNAQLEAGTVTHTGLVTGLSLMGDAAGAIKCWVMHSKVYFDLMKQALADKIFEVAGVTIYQGTVATFGRPVIVIDSAPLFDAAPTPDQYFTLGLVEDALTLTESEQEDIVAQVVTGLENLVVRIQGEYAFNLKCKGYQWDVTNGGAGPTDTALFTPTNWDKVAYDNKLLPGVRIVTQ